nr:hypothetical protein [Tanacetum cinerariifolium]
DVDSELAELQKVVKVVTTAKLMTKVVTVASATITDAAPQLTTAGALTLTTAPSAARRRKGVVIRDPEESATPSTIIHTEAKSLIRYPKESATPSTIIHTEAKSKDKGKGFW